MKVQNNSKIEIVYLKHNVIQIKQMVPDIEYQIIAEDRKVYELLSGKQQKEFEKEHKIKLFPDEVAEKSPLGLAIMDKEENEIGIMVLPEPQGVEHVVLIKKILNE